MNFSEKLKQPLTSICKVIGERNIPLYTVVPIAIAKGICRPISTMKDKKQDPETKKFAAIREGSTEIIAVPTYIGMSYLASLAASKFTPKEGQGIGKAIACSKTTLGFVGVCFAALIAIPGLCSLAMPFIMKAFGQKPQDSNPKPFNTETLCKTKELPQDSKYMQTYSPYAKTTTNTGGGMRV